MRALYRIDIMTLFPDTVGDVLSESILGRAQERDYLRIDTHQIRDYTTNRQNQVDDYPYGGGHGAVLQADPLYRCWDHLCRQAEPDVRPHTIFLSPCGKTFTQADARRLAWEHSHLILVCGHYEGIDQRFVDACVDEEISLGDFVLTGGEIAAMAVADAVSRLVPGVLSDPECFENESHWNNTLEYPQYSRPEIWHGMAVPEVLLEGNHASVERWRRKQSLLRTRERRPDLFAKLDLSSKEDQALLAELDKEQSRPTLPDKVICRKACEGDFPVMEGIAADARRYLHSHGVDQWGGPIPYPGRADFLADLSRGELYVLLCGDEIGAFFTLTTEPDPNYAAITDGKWASEEPYATIHRSAVAARWRGTGLADKMVQEAERIAWNAGIHWLRADTHKKNKPMQALLRRHNLQYRGNVLVSVQEGHDPRRVAYEKRIKRPKERRK